MSGKVQMNWFRISDELLESLKARQAEIAKLMECVDNNDAYFDQRADAQEEVASTEADMVAEFMALLEEAEPVVVEVSVWRGMVDGIVHPEGVTVNVVDLDEIAREGQ